MTILQSFKKTSVFSHLNWIRGKSKLHKSKRFSESELQSQVSCPICRSTSANPIVYPERFSDCPDSMTCASCGCWYMSEVLVDEYLQGLGKHGGEMVFGAGQDQALNDRAFKKMYKRTKQYHSFLEPHIKEGSKYLEFTSQYGGGVKCMQELGYDAYGLDAECKSAAYSKALLGDKILFGDVTTYASDMRFDIISLPRVLNHYTDPMSVLQVALNLLTGDGVIFFENLDAIHAVERKGLGRNLNYDHPINFSQDSLIELIRRAGLEIVALHSDRDHKGQFESLNHIHVVAKRTKQKSESIDIDHNSPSIDGAIQHYESKRWFGDPVFYGK